MERKNIPGTLGFTATRDGRIFDRNGKEKNQYTNLDGYKTAAVVNLKGKWQTFGVHRLVALAFIMFVGELKDLTVNHKDGNVTNNIDTNLEWVSVAENNIHAALLRGSRFRPVILGKNPQGEYEFIDNLLVAAKKFNCDADIIWEAIKDQREIFGWSLTHHKTTSAIPKVLHKENFQGKKVNGRFAARSVDILDIETKEVMTFTSIHAAASHHKVNVTNIHNLISTPDKTGLLKKKYLIVDSGMPFPELTQDEYEKCLAPFGKEVISYSVDLNQYIIYRTATEFIKDNSLSKKAVTVDLKTKRLRLLKSWWYTYNTPENLITFKKAVAQYLSRHIVQTNTNS